jgi:glycosyltransferase involved in cell wall biosynthesis
VPNGVAKLSDEYLGSLDRKLPEPYLLYFGYLDPRKQPCLLVEAFAKAKIAETHWLVFAGPDDYHHQVEIEQMVRKYGVEDRVRFTGGVYGDDKWAWIRHAECMCLPSKGEGQPLVVLESLGAGTPVVCSRFCNVDIGGYGEIVDDFEVEEWTNAIDRVVGKNAEQRRRNTRLFGRSFEWPTVAKRMVDCYSG